MAKLKDGFYKLTASSIGSDLLVLLAGGGAKPISDFASAFNVKLWGNTFNGSSDVNGAIQFATAGNTGSIKFLNGEFIDGYGNFHLGSNSTSWNVFDNNQNYLFTILKSGNVGIGTTAPVYKLDVSGTIKASSHLITNARVKILDGLALEWNDTAANGSTSCLLLPRKDNSYRLQYYDGTNWHYLAYSSDLKNPTDYYWANVPISASSNATTKPTFSNTIVNGVLTVNGGAKTLTINHNHTLSTAWNDFITCLNPNLTATYHTAHITFGRTYDSKNVGYIGFKYAGSASNSNMVTIGLHSVDNILNILASGNVGIGTISPSYKLHVEGDIYATSTNAAISINRTGTYSSEPCIGYYNAGTRLGSIGVKDYNTPFFWNASTSTVYTIWHSGNDGSGSGLDADMLDGKHLSSFITYELTTNYVGASFNSEDLSKKAASTYIEYWDSAGGWFNSRWGLVLAISGFHRVGSSDSYVLLGGGGHKALSDFAMASAYVKKAGDTMTGNLTVPSLNSYYLFKTTDIAEGAANLGTLATPHTITFFRNGIMIPYKMDNANDGGMIRTKGASESDCIFEIATWDDYGTGETILFNYYPTTSQLTPTYSVSVPKKSGTIALISDVPTKTSQLTNDSGYVTGAYLPLSGGTLTGPLTCAANGLIINSGGGDTAKRVLKAYGSGASNSNVYYINFGNDPSTSNCCELCFNYTGSGSTSNYAGMGFYGGVYFKVYANGNSVNPGTMTATHFYESSDVNLKTNIQTILNKDNIPQIKEFDWKESGEHSYGLIAQELEELGYSELVSTKDDGYKTVNYSAALSLIVGKLQVKIKELEKEIENLKSKN